MSEVSIKNFAGISGKCLRRLFVHPIYLCKYFELLTGSLRTRHLSLEVFISIPSHQDALFVSDGGHHEIDNFSLSLLEIVESWQRGTHSAIEVVIVITKDLL